VLRLPGHRHKWGVQDIQINNNTNNNDNVWFHVLAVATEDCTAFTAVQFQHPEGRGDAPSKHVAIFRDRAPAVWSACEPTFQRYIPVLFSSWRNQASEKQRAAGGWACRRNYTGSATARKLATFITTAVRTANPLSNTQSPRTSWRYNPVIQSQKQIRSFCHLSFVDGFGGGRAGTSRHFNIANNRN
jgi:hypothetical protein